MGKVKWIKPLEPTRCPWCGRYYYIRKDRVPPAVAKEECCGDKEHTAKRYENSMSWNLICVYAFILFYLTHKYKTIVFFVIALIIMIVYAIKLPDRRHYYDKQWWISVPKEPMLGRANIRWYRWKEGGIGFPRLRIVNNTIFAACLIDEKGIPVSHTFCVRLKKKWCFFWKGSKVLLISGEVSSETWNRADRIVIFNFLEKIGEGKVVTNLKG